MSVPEDVSDWIATPATLNDRKCGNNLVFSRENSIVQRRAPQYSGDCVIYTSHPLSPGQPWQMTVLERSLKCTGGLAIGVTATQSDVVPSLLDGLSSGPQDWYYWASVLYHNGRELSSNLPHLWDLNTNQKVGFLLSSNGDLHIYLDGQHIIKAASGLPVGKSLWGAVDVYGSCTKIKSELLNDPAVYLRVAMKDGYIPHKDDLFLIHGPGGVGKSSLVSMFLGKQRDLARVSTAVAEESLHICPVRDVSTSMFTDQWELVDIDRQARMVAHTSRHLLTNESVQKVAVETKSSLELVDHEEATETEPFLAKPAPSPAVLPTFEDTEPLISHNRPTQSHDNSKDSLTKKKSLLSSFKFWRRKRKKLKEAAKLSVTSEESEPEKLISTLGDDPENIQGILDRIQDDLQKLMHDSEEIMELFLYYSIHVVDSGGQPQFHEVVSIILQAVTAIVTVLKLSEPLDVHGEVVFYKDGVQANDAYKHTSPTSK